MVRALGGLALIALVTQASEVAAQSAQDVAPEAAPEAAASPRAGHTLYGMGGAFFMGIGAGGGAALGLYLSPSLALEADGYVAVSADVFGSSASMQAVGLGTRFFVNETFSARAGLRLRHIEVDEKPWLTDLFSTDGFNQRRLQTDAGLDVAIGHQWQWDHVVLAIDWIGAYVPVLALSSERQVIDPANDEVLASESGSLRGFADVRVLFIRLGVSG